MQTNRLVRFKALVTVFVALGSAAQAQPATTAATAAPSETPAASAAAPGPKEEKPAAAVTESGSTSHEASEGHPAPAATPETPTLKSTLNIKDGAALDFKEIVEGCNAPENKTEPYCVLSCVYADVICVNETGTPIPSEVVPSTVEPNTTLRFVVVARKIKGKNPLPKFILTETVGDMPFPRISKQLSPVREFGGWIASTVAYTMANDATTERIDFSQKDNISSTLVIRSNGGYRFVSVGAGLIIPTSGAPHIASLNPPDGSGARFEVTHDTKLRPALMLRVYPFGHRAQSLSPFSGPWPANRYKFLVALQDLLSLEAGINLEPARMTERLLVGVGLEPVTGLSFSWGVRFDQAERFRNGFSNGAFITANRRDAVESYLSVGQYLGVAINQHIYDLLFQGYSAFSGQSQSP